MEIKREDLLTECDKCGGSGEIVQGSRSMEIRNTCGACLGRGRRLTPAGKVLYDFMRTTASLPYQ